MAIFLSTVSPPKWRENIQDGVFVALAETN